MSDTSTIGEHLSRPEIEAGLPHVQSSPQDNGALEMIVVRPGVDQRRVVESCDVSAEGGVHGDAWAGGCWLSLPDGSPHPDVQISLINARLIDLLARSRDRWPLAGDNLYVDLDLSKANLPTGQRLAIGSAVLEVTAEWHGPCQKFVSRYGVAAAQHMNSPLGKEQRLRGIFAKVVQAGTVSAGDRVRKMA